MSSAVARRRGCSWVAGGWAYRRGAAATRRRRRRGSARRRCPQRRSYIAAAQVGPLIYTAGGMVGETGRPLATLHALRRAPRRVDDAPRRCRSPTRAAAGAAVDGRRLRRRRDDAGGQHDGACAPGTASRWRAARRCPSRASTTTAVALGGRVYVLGGFEGFEEHREASSSTTRAPTAGARPRRCRVRTTRSAPSRSAARSG